MTLRDVTVVNEGKPDPSRRPTLRDVARLAGVSLKTASRVVNDEPSVRLATRESVQTAIAQLGFRPHAGAASLRRRSTASIGLVVEDITDHFQAIITRAVGGVAAQNGAVLFVGTSDRDIRQERKIVAELSTRRVDGLILIPTIGDHSYLHTEINAGMRIVSVDRPIDGLDIRAFVSKNSDAGAQATEHLLAAGHRRIGVIVDELSVWTARERLAGYREALAKHGIPVDPDLVATPGTEAATVEVAYDRFMSLADPPTAIVTGNSHVTTALLVHLRELPPGAGRPALIGQDDHALFAAFSPGISVMAQDPHAIGVAAATHLFDPAPAEGEPLIHGFDMRLIARGSGEVAP